MAIAFTNLGASVFDTPADPDIRINADQSSYDTASWSPPTTGLIFAVYTARRTTDTPDVPTMSGNSITWDHINSFLYESSNRRLGYFVAKASGATTGATTINFGEVVLACSMSLFQVTGADETTTSSSTVEFATNSGTGTSGSATLTGPAGDSANRCLFAIDQDTNPNEDFGSAESNWTKLDTLNGLGHSRTTCTEYNDVAYDGSTSLSWTSSVAWGAFIVELKSAGPAWTPEENADETLRIVTGRRW